MTNLSAEIPSNGPVIRGFGPKGFQIDDIYYQGGIILTPDNAIGWDIAANIDPAHLSADDTMMKALKTVRPEFLLLGTGKTLIRPPASFSRNIEAMDIGVEVMDSRAAARAWSVLRLEERQIVGAIMPMA